MHPRPERVPAKTCTNPTHRTARRLRNQHGRGAIGAGAK
jgi:hypothetical protein